MRAAWLQKAARAWTDAPLEASLQATASVLEERLAGAPHVTGSHRRTKHKMGPPDRLMSLTQPILPICYILAAAGASCYESGPLPPTLLRPFADDVGTAVGGACAQRSLEGLRRQAFAQRKPWYMLAPSSLMRTLWDTAAILLIWVLLFTVPLSMGATGGAVPVSGPGRRSHNAGLSMHADQPDTS